MTCPRGHKPPIVQYLKQQKVWVCTRCGIEYNRAKVFSAGSKPEEEAMRQAKGGSK